METQKIGGKTQLYGIFAHPIKHSLSPFLHNQSFLDNDIDARYLAFDVEPNEFDAAMKSIQALNIGGLNLSMPYKEKALSYMDELSPEAEFIGAINTILNRDDVLIGYNTDGIGFVRSLEAENIQLANQRVVLLGAGGASKAVAYQLCQNHVKEIIIFKRKNRTFQEVCNYFKGMSEKCHIPIRVFPYEDHLNLNHKIKNSDIIVNCTNIGMGHLEEAMPINDLSILEKNQVVVDLIYQPQETLFLKGAKKRGCHTINGLGMLLYQAAEAFNIWTGSDMSISNIEETVKRKLYKEGSTS